MRNPTRPFSISGNSSKVESASRALVALVFLIALWFDPVQPVRFDMLGVALLTGFLAWSVVLIAVARHSWWWDHRLARAAHGIDIAVFVGAVYYTEAPSTDFSSPFMAFAVLLLIKARIRWDWRATAWTAAVLLAFNLAVAGTMSQAGYAVDLQRVGRRAAYMLLLAVVLVWMGLERRVGLALSFPMLPTEPDLERAEPDPELAEHENALDPQVVHRPARNDGHPLELLIATALRFACEATSARRAAIAWSAEQEPWIELGVSDAAPGAVRIVRVGPEFLGPEFLGPEFLGPELAGPLTAAATGESQQPTHSGRSAVLFASARHRALAFGPAGQRIALTPARPPVLAAHLGVDSGISVPITSDAGTGRLLLWDLADPGFDQLALAQAAAGEIGRAFEREERARLAQVVAVNGAVSGVREAIARDLHDSAAQFLAGTMFRLEALRRRVVGEPHPGVDAGTEIVAIKNAMRLEQAQLKNLIGQLRRGETADRQTELAQELTALLGEVGTHWRVAATLDCGHEPIIVPATLSHEVRQLVREGMANAARHGGADAVRVELAGSGAWLWLTISDNGRGFPAGAVGPGGEIAMRPLSIAGRVAALDGSLAISAADPHGARLMIGLPLRPVGGKDRVLRDPEHAGEAISDNARAPANA